MSTENQEIELLPGVESEPLFKTDEEYQKFRESFMEEVIPKMEEWYRRRLQSIRDAMFRIVG